MLRERREHKGQNGKVLVVGGSRDLVGAPALAALAALRTGVDLSVVAAPSTVAWTINNYSPDLITKKINGDYFTYDNAAEIVEMSPKFDCVLIGSGLGLEPSTMDFVKEVVERLPRPKVIDADAVKVIQKAEYNNAVLTPHAKEFEILTEEVLPKEVEGRGAVAKLYARKDRIILLKGAVDVITDGEKVYYNKTGNSGMTVGGTGDVLAGITAGLIAQGAGLLEAAQAAAYISGSIGDKLMKKKGFGFTASDMVELIPEFVKKLK